MKDKTRGVLVAVLLLSATGQPLFMQAPANAQSASSASSCQPGKDQAYLKLMLSRLKSERNPWERAKAATNLGIECNPAALGQLHTSLASDTSTQVRINAANAIARINQKASVKKLLQALSGNRGRTDVQIAIIRALGDMRSNSTEVVPIMVRFLRSPSPFVREATIEALAKIKAPKTAELLIKLLETEAELVVKLTLVDVVGDLKDPRAKPVLEKILKRPGEHADVKALAQDALDKFAEMGI